MSDNLPILEASHQKQFSTLFHAVTLYVHEHSRLLNVQSHGSAWLGTGKVLDTVEGDFSYTSLSRRSEVAKLRSTRTVQNELEFLFLKPFV
mgnify:CR=1 FL=1